MLSNNQKEGELEMFRHLSTFVGTFGKDSVGKFSISKSLTGRKNFSKKIFCLLT